MSDLWREIRRWAVSCLIRFAMFVDAEETIDEALLIYRTGLRARRMARDADA